MGNLLAIISLLLVFDKFCKLEGAQFKAAVDFHFLHSSRICHSKGHRNVLHHAVEEGRVCCQGALKVIHEAFLSIRLLYPNCCFYHVEVVGYCLTMQHSCPKEGDPLWSSIFLG